jgi:hypothetical protein
MTMHYGGGASAAGTISSMTVSTPPGAQTEVTPEGDDTDTMVGFTPPASTAAAQSPATR